MRLSAFPEIPANFVTRRAHPGNLKEKEQQGCQSRPGAGSFLQAFAGFPGSFLPGKGTALY